MNVYIVFYKPYDQAYAIDVCDDLDTARFLVRKYEKVDKRLCQYTEGRYVIRKAEVSSEAEPLS